MDEANFCNGFHFHIYKAQKKHFTDHSKEPSPLHFFGCLIKGTAVVKSENKELSLVPGEVFYIPKGIRYQSRWLGENGKELQFYSFGFDIAPTRTAYALQKVHCSDTAKSLFAELCQEIPFTEKGIGKLYRFFGEVAETMERSDGSYRDATVERAMRYISRHPDHHISQAARHCGVSESGLYALFRRHTDKTPNQVRLEALCQRAVAMLSTTTLSIQEISDTVGFSSTSYFRKTLRKVTGKTPMEIRKESAL